MPIILTGSSLGWGNMRTLADSPCPYTTRDPVGWKYKNLAGEWTGDTSEIVTAAGTIGTVQSGVLIFNLAEILASSFS